MRFTALLTVLSVLGVQVASAAANSGAIAPRRKRIPLPCTHTLPCPSGLSIPLLGPFVAYSPRILLDGGEDDGDSQSGSATSAAAAATGAVDSATTSVVGGAAQPTPAVSNTRPAAANTPSATAPLATGGASGLEAGWGMGVVAVALGIAAL
jgi:hypothetical protein